jgi:putative Holliday junction resolvase
VSEIISLDIGEKKTGIARASTAAKLPEPLKTVKTDEVMDVLDKLINDNQVEAVVVGLPRNLSGDDTAQTKYVRDWAHMAKSKFNIPFYFQDESLTTRLAQAHQLTDKKFDEDSLAASIILQDFLDTPESGKVMC